MFFYEGYICPVCNRKFQETDDIVACPECGAPHHRECWKQEGHCRFAADHGTPRQWTRPQEPSGVPEHPGAPTGGQADAPAAASTEGRTCPRCGQKNVEFAEFCSRCGQELSPSEWKSGPARPQTPPPPYQSPAGPPAGNTYYPGGYGEYAPIRMPSADPLGGVPQEEEIDGEKAGNLAAFVGPNSAYYVPRFYKMAKRGSRLSWNWPAFLITPYWLLYRKQYVSGGIVLALMVIKNFLTYSIMGTVIYPALDMTSSGAMYRSLFSLVESGKFSIYFAILSLLSLVSLLVRILFGLSSNALYQRCAVKRTRTIRKKTESEQAAGGEAVLTENYTRQALMQAGGVSLILVAVSGGIAWFANILFQTLFLYTT